MMSRDARAGRDRPWTESKMPQVVDFFSSSHTMQRFYLVPGLDP
jgi:hypothetical protein